MVRSASRRGRVLNQVPLREAGTSQELKELQGELPCNNLYLVAPTTGTVLQCTCRQVGGTCSPDLHV